MKSKKNGKKNAVIMKTPEGLGPLIDCTMEEFLQHFEGKNISYHMSFRVLLTSTYHMTRKYKDDLVFRHNDPHLTPEQREENQALVAALHAKLQAIEDRIAKLTPIIQELQKLH